jgi:hypothetical protein
MRIRSLRPSPGVLIGTIALVFALSGAAVVANKIQTQDIAKKAVTGSRIAKDAVKSGKVADHSLKKRDLQKGLIPAAAPTLAYGRVNKAGANVAPAAGAVGITGVANGGPGVICYDLAAAPVSGSATVVTDTNSAGSTVSLLIGAGQGCSAPFTDAQTTTVSAPTVGTNPYQEGSAANRDVYVQFVGG